MNAQLKFRPVSFSWVAIHPNPKGVVQFMGGAFFGTFPTVFYRYFLRNIFEQGYTIVALPFRFSFRHWPIAIGLLKEQDVLTEEIIKIANKLNYQSEVYRNKENYFWIGHSLGCKYITLLEFLSGDEWESILLASDVNTQKQAQQIKSSLQDFGIKKPSIKGQKSLLIAPDISDTQSAIPKPLSSIAKFLDGVGLGVLPTRKQTQDFVDRSDLFNLTALISFSQDAIAGSQNDKDKSEEVQKDSDVLWLIHELKDREFPIVHQEMPGKHLEPIGIKIGNYIVDLNPLDKFIEPVASRYLEPVTIRFLDALDKRQQSK